MRIRAAIILTVIGLLISSGSVFGVNLNGDPVFTANEGQWDDSILFRCDIPDGVLWLTATGRYYQLFRSVDSDERQQLMPDRVGTAGKQGIESAIAYTRLLGVKLADANIVAKAIPAGESVYPTHYYMTPEKAGWRSNVPSYRGLTIENVYPGIDCRYYFRDGQVEYDFVVAPGADASAIRLLYDGVDELSVDQNGNLELITPWGMIVERAPVAYQMMNGDRRPIRVSYQLHDDMTVSLDVASHDKSAELVIDPVLVATAYVGGSDRDADTRLAIDADGNAYLLGISRSTDFPGINYGDSTLASDHSIIVALDSTLSTIRYVIHFGTSPTVYPSDIKVAADGTIWTTGCTDANPIPLVNAFDSIAAGLEIWLAHFSRNGDSLLMSTYVGGSGGEFMARIGFDSEGRVHLIGDTDSEDFPGAQGSLPGNTDAYLLRLNTAGEAIDRVAFFGGSELDVGNDIVFDEAGELYLTGRTRSTDFPTVGSFAFPRIDSIDTDVFVMKLDTDWNPIYSVCFGGRGYDDVNSICVDSLGCVYVTGSAMDESAWGPGGYPLVNQYQGYRGATQLTFLSKLTPTGDDFVFSTLLGGRDLQNGVGLGIDEYGYVWVSGSTTSPDFPTANPIMEYYPSYYEGFLTAFTPDGRFVPFSTYHGGPGLDYGTFLALDGRGYLYLSGYSCPVGVETSPGYTNYGASCDLFVAKYKIDGSCCYGMRGEIDGQYGPRSFEPNISDLIFLVDYIYRGGAIPFCSEEADVVPEHNGLSIEELLYMVDYVFRSGPPPPPCPGFE